MTTDADGQYDPDEIPALLGADRRPVEADFVSGSRRLGSTYRGDGFRRLGVVFYAAVLRPPDRPARSPIPSFGLRAMRVEVATVGRRSASRSSRLPSCSSARRCGVPDRRRSRRPCATAPPGDSRKGPDLLYGARFGWVVLSTWWRERGRRPR